MDISNLEKFLHDRIKVDNKPGNLAEKITISKDKTKITFNIKNGVVFAKRYIKYLVKKYLKKQELRDWIRVIAINQKAYELRYFNIQEDEEEAEGEGSDVEK